MQNQGPPCVLRYTFVSAMTLPGIAVRSLTSVDIFQRHNIFLLTYKISLMLLLIYFSSEQALNFSPLPLN